MTMNVIKVEKFILGGGPPHQQGMQHPGAPQQHGPPLGPPHGPPIGIPHGATNGPPHGPPHGYGPPTGVIIYFYTGIIVMYQTLVHS